MKSEVGKMKRILLVFAVALLLSGCTQPNVPNVTQPNVTVTLPNVTVTINNETLNITPPPQNQTGNQTITPPISPYANYNLAIEGVGLNNTPTVSFFSTLSVKVSYEGGKAPSKYKVTYYDNGNLVEAKTVTSPSAEETVQFFWLPLSDGQHTLRMRVDSLDEVVTEDGPAADNEVQQSSDVQSIGLFDGDSGKEVSVRYWRAQQFIVQNKIGIGSISVYLRANERPDDVQIGLELRRDDFNKPGTKMKGNWLSATDIWVGAPQWLKVSYGTNGVYLEPGKYWIVLYLQESSANNPVWVRADADAYAGKSAQLDKEEGYGNIWHDDTGDYAFKVSTLPQ